MTLLHTALLAVILVTSVVMCLLSLKVHHRAEKVLDYRSMIYIRIIAFSWLLLAMLILDSLSSTVIDSVKEPWS